MPFAFRHSSSSSDSWSPPHFLPYLSGAQGSQYNGVSPKFTRQTIAMSKSSVSFTVSPEAEEGSQAWPKVWPACSQVIDGFFCIGGLR